MERQEQGGHSERLPLTHSQAAMWIQWKYAETSPAYNNPLLFELRGEVDVGRLQRAFEALVDRHEALRMRFVEVDGIPFQSLTRRDGEALVFHDLSGLERPQCEERAQALLDACLGAPFDLLRELTYRFSLLKLEERRFQLALNVHHICADGVSASVLLEEISRDYSRGPGEPVEARRSSSFLEYLAQEPQQWVGEAGEAAQAFWRRQLGGARLTVDFSNIYHPGPREASAGSRRWHWTLQPDELVALKQLVRRTRSTMFIVLASALKILLRRYTGQDEINLAYPVDTRPQGCQRLFGCLINYLPLNSRLSSRQTVSELIEALKESRRAARPFEDYPHLEIARIVREGNNFQERRVFNVALTSANFALGGLNLAGLDVQGQPVFAGEAKEDFGLLFDARERLHLVFEYRRAILADEVVQEMAVEFSHLLRQMAEQPSRTIDSFGLAADRSFSDRFTPALPPPEQRALSTFLVESLRTFGQSVLTEGPGGALSGERIDTLSDAVAHMLLDRGVRRGDRVGVQLSRTTLYLPALLGIWKVGACYVPIDPELPAERRNYIAEDAQLKLRLVDTHLPSESSLALDCPLSRELLDAWSGTLEWRLAEPDDIAYLIYTSGSTGRPKGVEVLHANAVSFLLAMQEQLRLGPGDRLLAVTTIGFDISLLELLLPITAGATVVVCPAEQVRDVFALKEMLSSERINHLQSTPSFFRMLIAGGWEGKRDLRVMCGGEALDLATYRFLHHTCRETWNFYGPTETTVWSMITRLVDPSNIHLGEPIRGTTIHLLDHQGRPVPRYVKGELFIGGHGVAKGYRNRPELTGQRFSTSPAGERLYRTGDIAYRSGRDELHFLGREDGQVKLRGYRIELGEIEHRLEALDGVKKAVVLPVVSQAAEQSLNAWVETAPGVVFTPGDLRAALSRFLPAYMIPTLFHFVGQWPLNSSGKVDRKALKAVEPIAAAERSNAPVPGHSRRFTRLEAIYLEILGGASIPPSLNIFELGGQSLSATRILARLRKEFSIELTLKEFMENSSLAGLDQLLSSKGISASAQDSTASRHEPSGQTRKPPGIAVMTLKRDVPEPAAGGAEFVEATPSSNEKAMFFIDSIAKCREAYNIPIALRFSGGLDVTTLMSALSVVLTRNEQLRASFQQTLGGIQKRIRNRLPAELIHEHPRMKWQDIPMLLTPLIRKPFNLSTDFLLRVDHFPLEEGDDVVLFVFHHIVVDGIACGHFLNELGRVYQQLRSGQEPDVPSASEDPADGTLEEAADPARLSRMIEEFGLQERTISLPYSAPFPDLRTLNGEYLEVRLPGPQRAALEEMSRSLGLPISVVLLAAYYLTLHHASRDEVINVGLATMNRSPRNYSRIGLLTNTVVLPIAIERDEAVLAFLQRVANALFSIYRYADVPFQDVVSRLVRSPSLGVTPMFQAFYNFIDRAMYDFSMGELRAQEVPNRPAGSKFELSLEVNDLKTSMLIFFEYSTDLFERSTIEALADLFRRIITLLPRSTDRSIERFMTLVR